MTTSLYLACFWAIAATFVALLPMRLQYVPGVSLLLLAPLLMGYLAYEHNVWIVLLAFAAVISMFRRPLVYYIRQFYNLPSRRPDQEGTDQ